MVGVIVRRGKAIGGGRQWQLWHYCHSITTKAYSQNCLRGGGGAVMSFGDGSHGALGLPSSSFGLGTDAYEPTLVPALPPIITTIAAGHYHSLAVTAEGHVWAWGRNREFQLGRSPSSNSGRSDSWNEPGKVQGLDQVRVSGVSASGVVSAAIGDDGSLWVWGKSKRGQLGLGRGVIESPLPSRVDSLAGEHIVKVSFGWGHALACTKDGKLFGWGYSADGRLGRIGGTASHYSTRDPSSSSLDVAERAVLEQMEKENFMPTVWEPTLVQESHGFQVSDIACGHDHSLVLFSGGRLISGGSNQNGQLGRPQVTPPQCLVDMLQVEMSARPLSISAGLGHSFATVKEAKATGENIGIFSWGSLPGKLCLHNDLPMQVKGLEGETPLSVSGGRVHSIALTSQGRVWVWGCGNNGRLGLGSSADEPDPIVLEYLQEFEVLQTMCGYDHSLVLVAN
ncbi:hypothetical protein Syun_010608 [Stephania yunnanensis]|uniref:RCC1-like domain-containing protein n=1 Tax=Stephania yunnanensis TaxID=152371 RepID=A0AAP0KIK7_9MAGN